MAYNTDSGWMLNQLMFQRASEGTEVKEALITCLEMLKASHDVRVLLTVKSEKSKYEFRSVVKDKKYYCEVTRTLYISDGVEDDIPFTQVYEYLYTDTNSKTKWKNIDDRFTLKYGSGKWTILYTEVSDVHEIGDQIVFDNKNSEIPNHTDTFTP